KENQVGLEHTAQAFTVLRQPCRQAGELPSVGLREILPPVLRTQAAIWGERQAHICAIQLFLHHYITRQQCSHLVGRQYLVVTRRAFAQPCKVRCVWKTEEVAQAMALIQRACFSACFCRDQSSMIGSSKTL